MRGAASIKTTAFPDCDTWRTAASPAGPAPMTTIMGCSQLSFLQKFQLSTIVTGKQNQS